MRVAGASLAFLLAAASPLWADTVGKVFTTDGVPVAGAQVWLLYYSNLTHEHLRVLGKVLTDEEGRFLFHGDFAVSGRYYRALAYAGGYAFGSAAIGEDGASPNIVLHPPGVWRVRVYGHDGQALSSAQARISGLSSRWDYPWQKEPDWCTIPEAIAAKFPMKADAEGMIHLSSCSDVAKPSLEVAAPGYARARVDFQPASAEVTLILGEPGSIEGRLECKGDPTFVSGRVVTLSWPFRDEATADEAGRFRFSNLPGGSYDLYVKPRPDDMWQAPPVEDLEVREGETVHTSMRFERAYALKGRVVGTDGRPLAGGVVAIEHQSRRYEHVQEVTVRTDANGYYSAHALPGTVLCRAHYGFPRPYVDVGLPGQSKIEIKPTDSNRVADLKLKRGVVVTGAVVDEAGQPVSHAVVIDYQDANRHYVRPSTTDERGRFELRPLPSDITYTFVAVKGDAMTEEAVSVKVQPGATVRLVLKRGAGAWVKGHVASADGAFAGPATVQVGEVRRNGWALVGRIPTAADGSFLCGPVPGGAEIDVQFQAPGHAPVEIESRQVKHGETWDVGTIELVGRGSTVAGRVEDIHGEPIFGAMVYGSSGTERLDTPSLMQGRFSLAGLQPEPQYIIAEKPGYYLAGVRVAPGGDPITLQLCPEGQTAPGQPAVEVTTQRLSPDEERAMLLRLVDEGLRLVDESGDEALGGYGRRLIRELAKAAPEVAMAMAEERGEKAIAGARTTVAMSLAERDPEKALAILAEMESSRNWLYHLTQYAAEVSDQRPDLARIALATVGRCAKAEWKGDSGNYLAYAAETYLEMGDRDKAEAAIEEAAKFASELGKEDRDAWRRGSIAARLALFDVDRGWKLIQTIRWTDEFYRQSANLAARVARTDPERALALYRSTTGAKRPYTSALPRIAYEAAGAHPDWALQMLREAPTKDKLYLNDQLFAFANVALRTYAADPAVAREAIQAIREATRHPKRRGYSPFYVGGYRWPALSLIAAAAVAGQCGDPHPQSLLLGAVLLNQGRRMPRGPLLNHDSVRLAGLLAFVDANEARRLFDDLIDAFGPYDGRSAEEFTCHLAAVSPVEAEQAIPKLVEKAKPEDRTECRLRCLIGLVSFLAEEPDDRFAHTLADCGFWVPEFSFE
jgi:tetratricopeptide (TPR) repeat protein